MPKKNEKLPKDQLIDELREELPPIWERPRTTQLTGGVVNSRTLANRMSQSEGPSGTFKMGRKVIIAREPFLEWFSQLIKPNVPSDSGVDESKGEGA